MIKRFISYYKPHRKLFFLDITAAVLVAVCDLFYPMVTRQMLTDYIKNEEMRLLISIGVLLVSVYVVKMFLNRFVTYYGHVIGVRMQADMRRDMFDRLLDLPVSFYDNNKTGSIMSRMISDLFDISELAHHGPEDILISGIMLIGSFVFMAHIYLPLTLIIFAFLPIMVGFAASKRLKMSRASTKSKIEIGEVNAGLENSISGIRVSKAYTSKESEKENFEGGIKKFISARSEFLRHMADFSAGTTFITDFLHIAMYVAGGIFCITDPNFTVVDFTTFVIYISLFTNPIKKLISFVEQYQNGMTGFRRFLEIVDTPKEEDNQGAVDSGVLKGDIEFENVSFSYDDGTKVLDKLSFNLEQGKTLALVGPSGGGKTTICNLIPRFYEIQEGTIRIDGKDIKKYTRKSLRSNIGIVSQDVFLFNTTVRENIAYGLPHATDEDIVKAAKLANIHDFIMTMPQGYDTVVGERGVKLSGGQKQRVSIARAFLKNPPILILDEATSALDNASEVAIQNSLYKLTEGRTVIVVAHRLSTIKNADAIMVITDEGIAERGNHEELISKNGVYSHLWKLSTGIDSGTAVFE